PRYGIAVATGERFRLCGDEQEVLEAGLYAMVGTNLRPHVLGNGRPGVTSAMVACVVCAGKARVSNAVARERQRIEVGGAQIAVVDLHCRAGHADATAARGSDHAVVKRIPDCPMKRVRRPR